MHKSADKSSGITAACLALCLIACTDKTEVGTAGSAACGDDGELVGEIFGSVRASIAWGGGTLECEGMPRPNGEGARLRFAGPADTPDGTQQLAFIMGLPDLVKGQTGKELLTNVTMMEEGTGRFFGTREASNCWTDIDMHEPLQPQNSTKYRISGVLYCVAPLANLNDNSSISFADLQFTGRLDWKPVE